ncbi:MAG: hypothetical protein NTAFB01_14600 [Nitrospira sp.]
MDLREIAPYNRFWREVLSRSPAQNQRRSPAGPERKEETRQKSYSLFSQKICPNNGGKLTWTPQEIEE